MREPLANIYNSGELVKKPTIRKIRTLQTAAEYSKVFIIVVLLGPLKKENYNLQEIFKLDELGREATARKF